MNNLFIITNSDIQCPGRVDPIVEYNHSLEKFNFQFYTTMPGGTNWTSRGSTFGKTQTGVKGKKVNPANLGYNHDFKETGHQIPLGQLSDICTELMKGGRAFSVVSSNTAHNMSAPLSRGAFIVHGWSNSTVKLVVNFDYHEDYGLGPTAPVVKSRTPDNGAWGQCHVCDDWAGIPNVTYIYAVIGTGSKGEISTIKSLKYTNRAAGNHTTTNYTMHNLTALVNGPCDVYITVDRDVLNNGFTHFYKDIGFYDISGIVDKLENLLAGLNTKGMNICGFDVTGVPCLKAGGKPEENFKNAVNDINTLYDVISPYLS